MKRNYLTELKSQVPFQALALSLSLLGTPASVHRVFLLFLLGMEARASRTYGSLSAFLSKPFFNSLFSNVPLRERLKGFESLNITAKRTLSFEGSFFSELIEF